MNDSLTANHKAGVILVCLSAVTFSTAGIFTKAVSATAWDVIFWRGISAVVITLLILWFRGGIKDELRRFRAPALLAAIIMASGTAAFIPAFKLTTIANVSIIWATAPFVTALLAWIFINEIPSRRVLVCSAIAIGGVLITVGGSFSGGNIFGDLLALWMTLMMSATMVLYRLHPSTPTMLPAALSSVLLLPFAMLYSDPMVTNPAEIGILVCFGAVFAAASVLLAEGARLIPSAQAALLSALETPLAPIWAVLILAEFPTLQAVVGGVLIMGAILFSQASFKRRKPHKGS
jgi:drug/metabolite transporter (DMT)-like permease